MRLQYTIQQCFLAATILPVALLLGLVRVSAAQDTDVPPRNHETDNDPNIRATNADSGLGLPFALNSFNGLEMRDDIAEDGESNGLDLVRRYRNDAKALANNEYQNGTVSIGEANYWYVSKDMLNGKRAGPGKGLPAYLNEDGEVVPPEFSHELPGLSKRTTTLYLSLTTCRKPHTNDTHSAGSFEQLELYVSQSRKLQDPGPGKDDSLQSVHKASGGYVGVELESDVDVFISVVAPNSTTHSGSYKYQIGASIDAYFHDVIDHDSFLFFLDSDRSAALLVTDNLTQSLPHSENYQQWMNITPPFAMYAYNRNDTALSGLEHSFCAVDALSQVGRISKSVEVGMIDRGLGNKPKQQFYITDLQPSTTYNGILAMVGNSTRSEEGVVGGGGTVYKAMNFTTKSDDNCAVLFNLTFCSEVAYAVPAHPKMTVADLRKIYDDNAAKYYQNFTYSLQQIQCNASRESMFSLAVNCDDCAHAYKEWLCSVSIPRCADFSANDTYLQVRNAGQSFFNGSSLPLNSEYRQSAVTNNSRNPLIDEEIQPGPYKEILPCEDICYDLTKSCPAKLGFACPTGKWLNSSYGYRNKDGLVTCSYQGAAFYLSVGAKLGVWGSVYLLGVMWGIWWTMW
ncbi:hypothetical protein N7492_002813 [Penicillium capsulatum]|uniref:Stretch-activated cation channel Mid1 n=1 Tax=Penicillium capsulatum TaxID=69766 RepID=A0A9W9LVK5_9EURO|nr:hypothetical protein N7492_002813 [Penicillium capsulatum]KAJ6122590.1 hypothetical protein N7512_005055 [Penicillium capsulatum]